jgi:serine O-acetyltransferase
MFERIRADMRRKCGHYLLSGGFVEKYIMTTLQLGTLAVFIYRFGNWVQYHMWTPLRWLLLVIYHPLNSLVRSFSGIDLDRRVTIGPGFIIHNFSGISIDAVRIGDNFIVNQGVSVGLDWRRVGRPVIGDNVFLGSGAKVLGDITLGNNVVVAANALVDRSVPDNCTVVGVPARVISREGTSSYLQLK